MKRQILLFIVLFGISARLFAVVHTDTIIVADYSFTPNSVTANLGDTILWLWSNGGHTTTSESIPAGASSWNSSINSGITSFKYVPTVAGIYNYECTIHASMGMTGSFTVANSSGINEFSNASIIKAYPNPVSAALHIQFNFEYNSTGLPVTVTLTDMNGRRVIKKKYKAFNDVDIDVQDIPDGTYILYAKQGNDVYHQQLVVAHNNNY